MKAKVAPKKKATNGEVIRWKPEERTISDLKGFKKNPRRFTEKGMRDLKTSIDRFGVAVPITINRDNTVIGGHARIRDMQERGLKTCWCMVPHRQLTEAEVEELCVRLNANVAGVFDWDALEAFGIDKLYDWGVMGSEVAVPQMRGINESEDENTEVDPEAPILTGAEEGVARKVEAYNDDVLFDNLDKYGIPIPRVDMFGDIPEDVILYVGKGTPESASYLYLPGTLRPPKGEIIPIYYTDDDRFEGIFYNPGRYLGQAKQHGVTRMLEPNFSMYRDWAYPVCLYNFYRNRWVMRYFQEGGIKVIPDFQDRPDMYEKQLEHIPAGIPCVSMQWHTTKRNDESVAQKKAYLHRIIETVKPKSVLFYIDNAFSEVEKTLKLPSWLRVIKVLSFMTARDKYGLVHRAGNSLIIS